MLMCAFPLKADVGQLKFGVGYLSRMKTYRCRHFTHPKNGIDSITNGESALRVLRRWRGMTQLVLSYKTALTRRHISDLENWRQKRCSCNNGKDCGSNKCPA